jgi:hypothetical protein
MELILNLVWLVIATALVCIWRTQWIPQRSGRARGRVQEFSAVSLALVLLFFAVSMSDDLHSEIVALEELSANKRDHAHAGVAHPSAEPISIPHPLFGALAAARPLFADASAVGAVASAKPVFDIHTSIGLKSDRAPPMTVL